MANFFKKVGIEAKILEGKASGFKHEPLMKETLHINKAERHEIKELRQALDSLLDRGKDYVTASDKSYEKLSSYINENQAASETVKKFANFQKEVTRLRFARIAMANKVLGEWHGLASSEIKQSETVIAKADRESVEIDFYAKEEKKREKSKANYQASLKELQTLNGTIHHLRLRQVDYLYTITEIQVGYLSELIGIAENFQSQL